jgi:hypothetical protein
LFYRMPVWQPIRAWAGQDYGKAMATDVPRLVSEIAHGGSMPKHLVTFQRRSEPSLQPVLLVRGFTPTVTAEQLF